MRGDEVIQTTARLLQDVTLEVAGLGAFVGHVGGDDFVIVCDASLAAALAERIIERFDACIGDLYDPVDRARGSIEVADRRGELQRFPIMTISIGIASTERRRFGHYAEVVAVATEMKSYTKKAHEGSSWAVDRRTA
jgi:GGDEF domain-containing protein